MVDADFYPGAEGLLAQRQLDRGERPAVVTKWRGFQSSKSLLQYARVIKLPAEVA